MSEFLYENIATQIEGVIKNMSTGDKLPPNECWRHNMASVEMY